MENIQAWLFSLLRPTDDPLQSDRHSLFWLKNWYLFTIAPMTSLILCWRVYLCIHSATVSTAIQNTYWAYCAWLLLNFDVSNQHSDIHMQFVSLRSPWYGPRALVPTMRWRGPVPPTATGSRRFQGTFYHHMPKNCPFLVAFPKAIILVNKWIHC